MKTSPYFLLIVNAFLAIGLTVISFQYVQPKNCYYLCDASYGTPCPKGSCDFGEQKAGWPFPAFVDAPGGGSPTGGWGLLGPEDLPLPILMIADVLFYSILVWIVLYVIQFFRHQAISLKLFLASMPLNVFLGASLWVFYLIFTFTIARIVSSSVPSEPSSPVLCRTTSSGFGVTLGWKDQLVVSGSSIVPGAPSFCKCTISAPAERAAAKIATRRSTTTLVLHWGWRLRCRVDLAGHQLSVMH